MTNFTNFTTNFALSSDFENERIKQREGLYLYSNTVKPA